MIGNLVRVSEDELNSFKKSPELFEEMVYREGSLHAGWYLDLDKSWEGIHYLLTGKSVAETEDNEPGILGRAIFSFQVLDEEQDLGYGPAQYLSPDQVIETNTELEKISKEEVKSRMNVEEMMEKGIYPEIWEDAEATDFLLESFADFQAFFKKAAERRQAVLSFIN